MSHFASFVKVVDKQTNFCGNLRDISDKIAKGEGTLGKLLTDDSLYLSAQSTLKKADRAIDGLGDSGPITAVGAAANVLF